MLKFAVVTLIAAMCCACSDTSTAPGSSENDASKRARTGYEQSLDRAREVEGQVLEAAEKQKQALEGQGGER